MGKKTLGPMSLSFFVIGRLMFGSSPCSTAQMRLGLSANTLDPAPNVHCSWPGIDARSFGHPWTTSYPPNTSWPPF
jgi:hypothetical protein